MVFPTFTVNSQNSLCWREENRVFIHELRLHDDKIGGSCATSVLGVTEHIFCDRQLMLSVT